MSSEICPARNYDNARIYSDCPRAEIMIVEKSMKSVFLVGFLSVRTLVDTAKTIFTILI